MSEILNKYKRWVPMLLPVNDEYWDFVLSQDGSPSYPYNGRLTERCLAGYINFWDRNCIDDKGAVSYRNYYWDKFKNDGPLLEDIGFTGMDNGLIYYGGWDKVTNEEFYDLFTNSKLQLDPDDPRLHLLAVTGNTMQNSYEMEYVENKYYALKGGFFQGFYKLFGFNYEILPQYIEKEWDVEITLRPNAYIVDDKVLNERYPENAGIFFYMGTRAEDKFMQLANCDLSKYEDRVQEEHVMCDEFFEVPEKKPCKCKEQPNDKARKELNKRSARYLAYFLNRYGFRDYTYCGCPVKKQEPCECEENCDGYFKDDEDYMKPDIVLSGMTIYTKDGKPVSDNGYYEIETDNKFLFFNRTKYGFTTATWDEDVSVVLTGSTNDFHTGNLFLLMNRTKNGYTTKTIDQYYEENPKPCDVLKDILGNAFALKYNEDGSISYRYLILDCDSEDGYKIETETSFPGLLKENEWSTVDLKFSIIRGPLDACGKPIGSRKMRVYIYVNGYLKLVSKVLPELNFRELGTIKEKQEGVPFNISVGGGTQGLCSSVWLDYGRAFPKILPLEKNFAGTFIGDVWSFRFYTCGLQYAEIRNNWLYEKRVLEKLFI